MQKPGFSHFAVSRGSFLRKVSPLRSETYRRNKRCYNPCHIQKLNISLMNHYKEKTRSVQLTRTKTPSRQHHHQCKNQNKNQERTTRKNRQKAHGPHKEPPHTTNAKLSKQYKKRQTTHKAYKKNVKKSQKMAINGKEGHIT